MKRRVYRDLRLTDGQFETLLAAYPHDPALQAEVCMDALYRVHPPIPRGRTQSGIPVYVDEGFNGSGYTMVHWDAAKNLSWCLDNGYTPKGFPDSELPLIWDEDPKREHLLSVRRLLEERAFIQPEEIEAFDATSRAHGGPDA
jgi:hypothetical protein